MAYTEDDINDLLRKAAENYSPRDGESNWEAILDRISSQKDPKKRALVFTNRIKKYFGLLILVPLSIAGWLLIQQYRSDRNLISKPVYQKEEQSKGSSDKSEDKSNHEPKSGHSGRYIKPVYTGVLQSSVPIAKNRPRFLTRKQESSDSRPDLINGGPLGKPFLYNAHFDEKISVELADSLLLNTILNYQAQRQIRLVRSISHIRRSVYFGALSAIDFSSVKSSAIDHAGYAFGFIAGYNLNKRFSLETGLILNKRNYNSDGRHFDMEKVKDAMPDGMEIHSLYTTSSVMEFPVKLKYQFVQLKRSGGFVSAGTSAYLITAQQNDYDASMNGNDEQFTGMYTKNELLLPAVFNIGLGYEYSISHRLNIRAEPFLKIPFRGMGIGNLPVTSAGVQLGVTRRFN